MRELNFSVGYVAVVDFLDSNSQSVAEYFSRNQKHLEASIPKRFIHKRSGRNNCHATNYHAPLIKSCGSLLSIAKILRNIRPSKEAE